MNRTNLNVPYQVKDQAKLVAAAAGTRIRWDAKAKTWYWQGEGELPAALNSYRHGTRESYARNEKSWNDFQTSEAGAKWNRQQDELAAEEFGYESVEAMKKANADLDDDQMMTLTPEEEAMLDEIEL